MGWMQKLYETYERCYGAPQFDNDPLMPVGHTQQQAHIEIVLDDSGKFRRAKVLEDRDTTIVPATEDSAGRTSKPVPHPLCDKIQYCAGDYKDFGGGKDPCFEPYLDQLSRWQDHSPTAKVAAILQYVRRGTVVADLVQSKVLQCNESNVLLTEWPHDSLAPAILRILPLKDKRRDQGDAFVRWRVEGMDASSGVWDDASMRDSWIRFLASQDQGRGICMVTGEIVALAKNHPKRLRHAADGAKLLSSNDMSGFTFRGRFADAPEAGGVGSIVSQKAHTALRWLITRQSYKSGDQVFVSWTVNGKQIPDPFSNTTRLLGMVESDEAPVATEYTGDTGQHYALRLSKAIAGYRAGLTDSDGVIVMGLDSATPGRMAIPFYRELSGSEFLSRVQSWHEAFAWFQDYSKNERFLGAPAPKDIAEAIYGKRIDDKLRKATVERLLPCIIDARPVPRDVVDGAVRRASNRAGLEIWEWERCLGIACSLVRGSSKEKYSMSLEEGRITRDYLYGRLLAIAENIEQRALYVANEQRDTNAGKLMQRFASHPYSTWRNIELSLVPYKTRLRNNRPAVLIDREKLLDAVQCMFQPNDFMNDSRLAGEFLLGYHCQRAALWAKSTKAEGTPSGEVTVQEGELS